MVKVKKLTNWQIFLSFVLGFLAGQGIRYVVFIILWALVAYFFLYRKSKNNGIWTYFIIGFLISLAFSILFAGIVYVYLFSR